MTTSQDPKALDRRSLEELVREQQAALGTYKDTLGRIYQEFDSKIEELSLIRRVSDVLRGAEDLRGLGLGLVEVVMSELPADFVSLMLTDPEMTTLQPVALFHREWNHPAAVDDPDPAQCTPLSLEPLGTAVSEGRVLIVGSMDEDPGLRGGLPSDLPDGAASLIALPLVARQQILGTMLLVSLAQAAFGQEHTRTLSILCDHAAAALVNVRLIDQLGEFNERLLASELEAHQAKEHLQYTLDAASDLILIADAQGMVTYVNLAADELGLSRQRLIGRPLASLFEDSAKASALFALPGRSSGELSLAAPTHGSLTTLVSHTPLAASGEVLAIVRDITQRKALERQLMHAEKLASVGILAAGVAHEIGNPLSAVSGYAQLLAKGDVGPEDTSEFAGAIAEQAERIDHIIRNLLEYSRPSPHEGQAVEVGGAIEAVLDMFFTSKRLAGSGLSIKTELADDLPPVVIDRDQLQQVVLNIAMNAAQALEETGGELLITTGRDNSRVIITFSDNGPGMAPKVLERIFDPFYTTKPVEVGGAIEAVLDMFFTSKRLAGSELSIKTELAEDLPPVVIDRDQLQQVVLNIAMNAAQALEETGGELLISTGRDASGVVITFSDNGPGMAPKVLERIFDPFYTTKPVGKGTGLGLSICDRIISRAGGRIEAASTPGGGTTFTVSLPSAQCLRTHSGAASRRSRSGAAREQDL